MSQSGTLPKEDTFFSMTEGLVAKDAFTRDWLEQVILRLRRELTWQWRNQEGNDRLTDLLEGRSSRGLRESFFLEDPSARYLHERIRTVNLPNREDILRGSLAWLAIDLKLSDAEVFVVALALACARDAAVCSLIAALHGDVRQQLPTLGLAQLLWDEPGSFLPLMSSVHPIFARGVLRKSDAANEWSSAITMPALVAQILEGGIGKLPSELELITEPLERLDQEEVAESTATAVSEAETNLELLAYRMAKLPVGIHLVPIDLASSGIGLDAKRAVLWLRKIAALTGRSIFAIRVDVVVTASALENAVVYCWMNGGDLLLPSHGMVADANWQATLRPFPIYVFVAASESSATTTTPTLPTLVIPSLTYAERREVWQEELSRNELGPEPDAVRECAYRFRMDATAIAEVVATLRRARMHKNVPLTVAQLIAACHQQVRLSIGSQATLVIPRFGRDDLVLDAERGSQFDQLVAAMRSLSRVHAEWGTGKAWGDAGVSALFAGAPGTGKTMAAEVIAAELQLPMYRIDLSQVVNKYIGETEKNLRLVFDAAEQSDIVLFFDEADALFGRRTEVKSSNDRFANIEVSYLLERMERFRGLVILATNRRKDLDDAFLRRLRYVIEFPLPGEDERLAIWRKSIPCEVSGSDVNLEFLAREFALAGGNIRSIVLDACLQSAPTQQEPALQMDMVMSAVEREYEKIGRPLTREQKTQWCQLRLRNTAERAEKP